MDCGLGQLRQILWRWLLPVGGLMGSLQGPEIEILIIVYP